MINFSVICWLIFIGILQNTIFNFWSILNVHFEILFCFSIFYSIKNNWKSSVTCGFYAGLIQDIFSLSPHFGLSCLTYGLFCFLTTVIKPFVFMKQLSSRLFLILILTISHSMFIFSLIWVFSYFQNTHPLGQFNTEPFIGMDASLRPEVINTALINTLLCIPFFKIWEKTVNESRY